MNATTSAGALLDPRESSERARPLRSWSQTQKEAVRSRFALVLRDWHADWIADDGLPLEEAEVQVGEAGRAMRTTSQPLVHWRYAAQPPAPSRTPVNAIANRMFAVDLTVFGSGHEVSLLAPAIAAEAWTDWMQRLAALLVGFALEHAPAGADGKTQPADPWSGALEVQWPWCGGRWHLALPFEAVTALLGADAGKRAEPAASPPATATRLSLGQALGSQPLNLRVMLDGAELSLGQLQGLQVDDIVPLDQLLEKPVHIVTAEGVPVCDGWLGRCNGRIAVELAVAAPSISPLTTERVR